MNPAIIPRREPAQLPDAELFGPAEREMWKVEDAAGLEDSIADKLAAVLIKALIERAPGSLWRWMEANYSFPGSTAERRKIRRALYRIESRWRAAA